MAIDTFTAIDFETAQGKSWSICQVGLVRVENGIVVDEFQALVRPPDNFYNYHNIRVHGITPQDTESAPDFDSVYSAFAHYIDGQDVVAHNVSFDARCLLAALEYYDIAAPQFARHCTYKIFKAKLNVCCEQYGIQLRHHDALSDARACAMLFRIANSQL